MVRSAVRSLWAEPRAPQPPVRVWRDWAPVAALVPVAILEGALRDQVVARPVALLLGAGLVWTLLWRRTHPLAAVAVAFGALIVGDVANLIGADGPVGLYTMAYLLLLPYSLVRWGSGRQAGIRLAIIVVALVLGLAGDYTGLVDSSVGSMILLFPATPGAALRYWASARSRELDQVKLQERQQLARELHDTVAHHVSAIAIRAQAGRLLATSDPGAAVDALEVIDREASCTLAEMRVMVGGLREVGVPALAPEPGVVDIEGLARGDGDRPHVEVCLSGDLDDLTPLVGTALYRIAQESVTNAVRHARRATRVTVRVETVDGCVRLTVDDDGDVGSTSRPTADYGLVGMTERAILLGGSFQAGPSPDQGWTVRAVLPMGNPVR